VKLLVLWGSNPVWSNYTNQHYFFRAMKERGVKIIAVDPWFNPGNNAYADYWVPCRPGTDAALILGIAHELITNNWVDEPFVFGKTLGYDEDHMPLYENDGFTPLTDENGIDLTEMVGAERKHKYRKNCFKNYVMGTSDYDSVPKNAAWASAICGAPEALIKQFAMDLGTIKPAMINNANAPARTFHGGSFAQGIHTLRWITGNVGKAGNGSVSASGSYTANVGYSPYISNANFMVEYAAPRVVAPVTVNFMTAVSPSVANPKAAFPYGDRGQSWNLDHGGYNPNIYYGVAYADLWNTVITGKHRNFTDNIHSDSTDAEGMGWKNQEIRAMVKLHGSNPLNQFVNARRGIEAFRDPKVEFIFVQDVTFGATAQHADIVVPFLSLWETDGQINYQNREMFIGNAERVIPPLFEAKTSKWTDGKLCEMFGGQYTDGDPIPQKQASFNYIANTKVKTPDGAWKWLVSFTDADIAGLGVKLELDSVSDLSDGQITYQEFKKQGFYKVRFNEGMRQNSPAPATVPDAQKAKIYAWPLKEYYDKYGFSKIEPICFYQESQRGYEEAVSEPEYPLQMINVVALARVLGRPGSPSLKEIFGDGVYINPLDAEPKGILKSGDPVLITSKAGGRALLHAIVTETIMPGVIMSPMGIAIDPITVTIDGNEEEIDAAGNSNFLSDGLLCAGGHEAFNTCLVKVERWTGTLPPDYTVNSMADKLKNVF
jgi:anaerobic dimethyl sulfoxide reductase subunit A